MPDFKRKHVDSPRPRIVGAGMVVLDVILNNGAPTPQFRAGGTCGNIISGLSFLGWESICVSRAGSDLAGRILVADLARNGVNTAFVTQEDNLTTPRIIERVSSDGRYAKHNFLMRCPECNAYLPRFRSPRTDALSSLFYSYDTADVFIFDKVTPSTLRLAKWYRKSHALVFFEPSSLKDMDSLAEGISVCHVLKYSSEHKNGQPNAQDEFERLVERFRIPVTIHTHGEKGLSFRMSNGIWHAMKSYNPAELNDTCGAGDWASIGFLYHLASTRAKAGIRLMQALGSYARIRKALSFAQALSSLSCMFVGARGMSYLVGSKNLVHLVNSRMELDADSKMPINRNELFEYGDETVPAPVLTQAGCPVCLLGA